MTDTFITNRDPGDEQDEPIITGKDYYLVLNENGCLDIPKEPDTDDSSD